MLSVIYLDNTFCLVLFSYRIHSVSVLDNASSLLVIQLNNCVPSLVNRLVKDLVTLDYVLCLVRSFSLVQVKWNTNLMQHFAGFISAGSLYMFRAQAPIIRSI